MAKFHVMRGIILGVAIASASPSVAKATEKGIEVTSEESWFDQLTSDENKEAVKEKAQDVWDALVDFSVKADQKANQFIEEAGESLEEIKKELEAKKVFSVEDIWLIKNVKEEENPYFFVLKSPHLPSTVKYYDSYGNKVNEKSMEAVYEVYEARYVSVLHPLDEKFVISNRLNLKTEKILPNYVNLVDGNWELSIEENLQDENLSWENIEYIRFPKWSEDLKDILPAEKKNEEGQILLSKKDLQTIIDSLNTLEVEMNFQNNPDTLIRRR